jgi:hypothetical protein
MSYPTSSKYERKPLYPGPSKYSSSNIATKYTSQKEVKDRRNPTAKYTTKPSKMAAQSRGFENEEDKIDPYLISSRRLIIDDLDNNGLEALRKRIEILEDENKRKDVTINKLKAENGQLRAQKNVMHGKLKREINEEAKEKRNTSIKARKPDQAWISNANKVASKCIILFHRY